MYAFFEGGKRAPRLIFLGLLQKVYAYLRNRGFIVWRPSSSYVAKFARSFQNFAGFELISFVGFKPDAKFAKCSQRLPDFLFLVIE